MDAGDSRAVDGRKWLQALSDCGFASVRDEAVHRRPGDEAACSAALASPNASSGCCRAAARMGAPLGRDDNIEPVAPVELKQFMLRFGGDDAFHDRGRGRSAGGRDPRSSDRRAGTASG
ncbi:MAG: hypothetical protein RQ833_09850 [Sphingomonadaceae bacterium]|nr:hypothetical protein [Sphingomonadaceae bacterium]